MTLSDVFQISIPSEKKNVLYKCSDDHHSYSREILVHLSQHGGGHPRFPGHFSAPKHSAVSHITASVRKTGLRCFLLEASHFRGCSALLHCIYITVSLIWAFPASTNQMFLFDYWIHFYLLHLPLLVTSSHYFWVLI